MVRHSTITRTVPPLVAVLVITCVWYALENRPGTPLAPVPPANAAASALTVLPSVSPVIQKHGEQVQFSVNPAPLAHKHIQKVEFYVESQFVGTAYSRPYTVAVSENAMAAGTHTVVAKIYTVGQTAQSQPATFVTQPTAPVAPSIDTSDAEGTAVIASLGSKPPSDPASAPPSTTPPPVTVLAPTDLAATASTDGTAVTLTWTANDTATGYEVWRDGAQIATTTGVGYTDTGLNPGQTYDYTVVAVNGSATSQPSEPLAVTTPTPQDTSPVNTEKPDDTEADPAKIQAIAPDGTSPADTTTSPETTP